MHASRLSFSKPKERSFSINKPEIVVTQFKNELQPSIPVSPENKTQERVATPAPLKPKTPKVKPSTPKLTIDPSLEINLARPATQATSHTVQAISKPVNRINLIDYHNLLNSNIWASIIKPKAKLSCINRNLGDSKKKIFA